MTAIDQGPLWFSDDASEEEPQATPAPRARGGDPSSSASPEEGLLDVGGPPPKVWAEIARTLRSEGLMS